MSSAVISTSAAPGRPFVFDTEAFPEVPLPSEPAEGHLQNRPPQRVRAAEFASTDPRLAHITPASRLNIRPAPEMVSSGVPAIDALAGGLPRGCLTEICGPASSGRTTLLLSALAAATRRGEFCVVVDASDALDPHSAAAAGVDLDRLLWVRCSESSSHRVTEKRGNQKEGCPISRASSAREVGRREVEAPEVGVSSQVAFDFDRTHSRQSWHRLEQALRATDLLLESGGFGLIVLDLGDMPQPAARRIPLTTWFRFRRAIEHTPTILLAIEQHPIAGSCSSLLLQLGSPSDQMPRTERTATERRKNAAHGPSTSLRVNSSRGWAAKNQKAPEGRKKICVGEQSTIDFHLANPTHAQLLTGLEITADIRSRLERKPALSVMFASKTAWAG
jgi:recombination protein RecA